LKKHVLIIASEFPTYSETFVVDHVKGMLSLEWNVSVAANKIDQKSFDNCFSDCSVQPAVFQLSSFFRLVRGGIFRDLRRAVESIASHPNPNSLNARLIAVKAQRLSELIQTIRPDLVHAHFGPNGVLAAIALENNTIPLIVNFHGYDVTAYTKKFGWNMYQSLLKTATLVGHSQFVSRRILRNLGRQIELVVMGVDTGRFSPNIGKTQVWPSPLKLLSVGRLTTCKGHDIAIDTVKLLNARHPNWNIELVVVGSGEEQERLTKRIKFAGLSGNIRFRGSLDYRHIPGVMQSADILLVCSQPTPDGSEEAFCRVAVEAMACGMAIVATPCGGLPDTVDGAGYVTSGFDAASIAEAVELLVSSETPASAVEISVKAAKKYDIKKMMDDYKLISEKVLLLP